MALLLEQRPLPQSHFVSPVYLPQVLDGRLVLLDTAPCFLLCCQVRCYCFFHYYFVEGFETGLPLAKVGDFFPLAVVSLGLEWPELGEPELVVVGFAPLAQDLF